MKAGVDDFVEWGKPEHLIPAVERALRTSETRRLNRLAEQEMHFRANFDSLTGLPNRTLMFDRLSQAIKSARRNENGVLFMYLDPDYFKTVNDSFGHLAGDQLLRQVAERITSVLRDSDTAARIGGDEFAIILPEANNPEIAERIAGNLLTSLAEPFDLDSQQATISASIGITQFPADGEEPDALMKKADQAMYAAKRLGRNAFKVFSQEVDDIDSDDGYIDTATLTQIRSPVPDNTLKQVGFALAAALAVIVVASVWMTSMNTKDELRIAIDENMETLTDFTTASGEEEE